MERPKHAPVLIGLCLAFALSFIGASVQAEELSLHELKDRLQIDRDSLSVSGISSGAFMAQQFHVAHSSKVMGLGAVAGGPYGCSEGSYFASFFDLTGLYAALYICSATNPLGLFNGPPDVDQSIAITREEAEAGRIDDPQNLRTARVWLFAGANDETVPQEVVESVATYYSAFLDPEQIALRRHPQAGHAMITDDFGNHCEAQATPYINDCDFDAAEALLRHIYGPEPLMPKAEQAEPTGIIAFDQTEFFDQDDRSVSMHALGHVYLPERCARGERCRLHVAFHGCRQHQDEIGDSFYASAGYNEVAETNDIVVLYPQTRAWSESLFFGFTENPRACWDWWGYSGEAYFRRSGKQISAVAKMINALVGDDFLPQ